MKIKRARLVTLLRFWLSFLFVVLVQSGSTEVAPVQLALASGNNAAFVLPQSNSEPSMLSSTQPLTATYSLFLPLILKDYESTYTFALQSGSPAYLPNFANPNGCNWLGIAGQAFNSSGQAIVGLIVHLEGNGLNQDALTGSKPVYGAGGYEHYLNDHVIAANYSVQLRNSGTDVSPAYQIPTFVDCNKNLVLVNFVQIQ